MSFDVTAADIQSALTPFGFNIEVSSALDPENRSRRIIIFHDEQYLRITHPDNEGIAIEATLLKNANTLYDLRRKVEGGVEAEMLREETAKNPPLYTLVDFHENLYPRRLNSISEFVKLVQERIVPATVL